MNTTVDPSSIEGGVAALYPKKSLRDAEDQERQQRTARQSLSLGSFVKPFFAMGGNFLKMLWRAVVAMVQKVASVFKVDVAVPDVPPAHASRDAPVAEFSSGDATPAGEEAVQGAAQAAAKDIADLVSQLTGKHVDKDRMRGPDGPAYAALNLQALGSALDETRASLSTVEKDLDAAALAAAQSCGAPLESMKSLLKSCDFSDPASAQFFPPEVQDLARKRTEIWSQLCKFQLQFCDFAIEGLRAGKESGSSEMEALSRTKVSQFADQEMTELIFEQSATQNGQVNAEKESNSGSLNIESQKTITPVEAGPEKAAGTTATARRRWAGMSAGVVDEQVEDDSEGVTSAPRER